MDSQTICTVQHDITEEQRQAVFEKISELTAQGKTDGLADVDRHPDNSITITRTWVSHQDAADYLDWCRSQGYTEPFWTGRVMDL